MLLNFAIAISMVGVAQLVRAPGCGPGGRGFKSHHSPNPMMKDISKPSWLNWIEHWVSAPAVTGSNPVEGTTSLRRAK